MEHQKENADEYTKNLKKMLWTHKFIEGKSKDELVKEGVLKGIQKNAEDHASTNVGHVVN